MRQDTPGEQLQSLFKRPFFSTKEVRELGVNPSLLAYYEKQGIIERLQRGLYKGTGVHNDDFPIPYEDLIYATASISDSVICLVSALSIYELTEEIPRQLWLAIPNSKRAPERKLVKIIRFRDMELGRTTISFGETEVPIFDKERCVVDAVKMLSRESGIKTLRMYLQKTSDHKPDIRKLLAYAKERRVDKIYPYVEALTV